MFTRIEGLLRNITDRAFVSFLLAILVVRVGPSPIGEPWVKWVYDASEAFPKATSHISFSFLPVFLAKMFGEPPVLVWWSIFGLILILWFLAVMNRLKTLFPNHYRMAQVIFASSQVVMLQTTFIGHYDNISVIAASLVFLWNSPWLVCIAAMAAAGANPSMSFATGVCVLTLYFGTRNSYHFFAGLAYFLTSSVTLVSLHFWLNAAPGLTREGIVLGELASVAKVSLGIWSFNFLSVLGPLWLVFAFLFFKETWSISEISGLRRFWVFLGVIGIPTGMTFFNLDGSN